jgi:hypothetical protein
MVTVYTDIAFVDADPVSAPSAVNAAGTEARYTNAASPHGRWAYFGGRS